MMGDELKQQQSGNPHGLDWQIQLWLRAIFGV